MTLYNYMQDGMGYGDIYFWSGYEKYMHELEMECLKRDLDRLKHPEKYVVDFDDDDEELPF